jgi:hypothetical protein
VLHQVRLLPRRAPDRILRLPCERQCRGRTDRARGFAPHARLRRTRVGKSCVRARHFRTTRRDLGGQGGDLEPYEQIAASDAIAFGFRYLGDPCGLGRDDDQVGAGSRRDRAGRTNDRANRPTLRRLGHHRHNRLALDFFRPCARAAGEQGHGDDAHEAANGHGRGAPTARSRAESALWNPAAASSDLRRTSRELCSASRYAAMPVCPSR